MTPSQLFDYVVSSIELITYINMVISPNLITISSLITVVRIIFISIRAVVD